MAPSPLISTANMASQSTMTDKAHLEFTDPWSIHEDRRAGIFAWVIMGLIASFFIGLVVRDMVLKFQSRELQDELRTFGELLVLIFRLPCMLFDKDNYMPLWYGFTNIFRSAENKRGWKTKEREEEEARAPLQFDSKDVVARLGGGWPMDRSQTSSDPDSDIRDKDIEVERLPKVAEAIHMATGLPKIEKLAIVFEVPEILPSGTNVKDEGFQPTSVYGSGVNSLSQVTSIFKFESSQDHRETPTVSVKEVVQQEPETAKETGTEGDEVSSTEKACESSSAEKAPGSPSTEPKLSNAESQV
ncbi:hypothetical protein FLONG3_7055 [Fusarium longipes]|uniref:Uncharacterized protein n=1 Tax=Fusarium longipes TaxID=694270 RepID=A0A395SGT7_9HYPO|nr:hypothetical protein FLONG3_7055 [Fusarium longipes]